MGFRSYVGHVDPSVWEWNLQNTCLILQTHQNVSVDTWRRGKGGCCLQFPHCKKFSSVRFYSCLYRFCRIGQHNASYIQMQMDWLPSHRAWPEHSSYLGEKVWGFFTEDNGTPTFNSNRWLVGWSNQWCCNFFEWLELM